MEKITRTFKVGIASKIAFQKFVDELNEWWPREYTWSQNKLEEIKVDGRKNGLCTEIGPNGFRCDWGTVTEFTDNSRIKIKWQISPKREPVPDIDRASNLTVEFIPEGSSTTIKFDHSNFENHGEDSKDYKRMMDSPKGWDYILNSYKKYCEHAKD